MFGRYGVGANLLAPSEDLLLKITLRFRAARNSLRMPTVYCCFSFTTLRRSMILVLMNSWKALVSRV